MTDLSKHLYTAKDVQKVREKLYKEQGGIDPITGLIIPEKQKVLDHDHSTQYVRSVLHRQTNAVLGKIENLWTRYSSYWYTGTLPDFLRGCADYIEKKHPQDYIHPNFIKKLQTNFNKLNEKQKQLVLLSFGEDAGVNAAQRKVLFKKFILKRTHSMEDILQTIQRCAE